MDIRQLEYFLQIANHRGFNRASAHLHIAQSSLSRHMSQLEHELGVDLFVRSGQGVFLTPAGEMMAQRVEALLRQVRQLREEVHAEAKTPRGEVAIGLPPSLRRMLAVPLLTEFRDRFPAVFIKCAGGTSAELRDLVLGGVTDLSVIGALEPDSVLDTQPLFRDALCLAGPPDAALRPEEFFDLATLDRYPLVLTSRPNSLRILLDQAALRKGVAIQVIMEVNNVPLLMDMVESAGLYSVLPYSCIHDRLAAGRLSASKLRYATYNWVVASSRERPMSAAARLLRDMMHKIVHRRIVDEAWPNALLAQDAAEA